MLLFGNYGLIVKFPETIGYAALCLKTLRLHSGRLQSNPCPAILSNPKASRTDFDRSSQVQGLESLPLPNIFVTASPYNTIATKFVIPIVVLKVLTTIQIGNNRSVSVSQYSV